MPGRCLPLYVLEPGPGESGPLRSTESPRPGGAGVIGTGNRAGDGNVLMCATVLGPLREPLTGNWAGGIVRMGRTVGRTSKNRWLPALKDSDRFDVPPGGHTVLSWGNRQRRSRGAICCHCYGRL